MWKITNGELNSTDERDTNCLCEGTCRYVGKRRQRGCLSEALFDFIFSFRLNGKDQTVLLLDVSWVTSRPLGERLLVIGSLSDVLTYSVSLTTFLCFLLVRQEKCAQYWPTAEEREMAFRDTRLLVTLLSEDTKSYYTTRVLELQNISVGRSFTYYQGHYYIKVSENWNVSRVSQQDSLQGPAFVSEAS